MGGGDKIILARWTVNGSEAAFLLFSVVYFTDPDGRVISSEPVNSLDEVLPTVEDHYFSHLQEGCIFLEVQP